MGMHETTLDDLKNALGQIEMLQRETVELLRDVKAEIESLAAMDAELNLKDILHEMASLANFRDKAVYDSRRKKIVETIQDKAEKDLRSIHHALVGHRSGVGLDKQGLFHHVYSKLERRLTDDKSFTMQEMAMLLDKHFLSALILQWNCKRCLKIATLTSSCN